MTTKSSGTGATFVAPLLWLTRSGAQGPTTSARCCGISPNGSSQITHRYVRDAALLAAAPWFPIPKPTGALTVEASTAKPAYARISARSISLRAFAAADLCAAGFGAPHIRQRSFWVAHHDDAERGPGAAGRHERNGHDARWPQGAGDVEGRRGVVRLDHTDGTRHLRAVGDSEGDPRDEARVRLFGPRCEDGGVACADGDRQPARRLSVRPGRQIKAAAVAVGNGEAGGLVGAIGHNGGPPINGFWSDADWLGCRDGKWRPVEPGTFPLAHGAANRVGRLRGYGNAIVGPVAQGFIEAVMASDL